jgi:hypothetical protein
MPYIRQVRREALVSDPEGPQNAGEFNYLVSELCNAVIKKRGLNYALVNELVGALECAKLELYRRVAAPYEDTKIAENGDVYN